jgi:hypothetical protein
VWRRQAVGRAGSTARPPSPVRRYCRTRQFGDAVASADRVDTGRFDTGRGDTIGVTDRADAGRSGAV